MVLEEIEKGVPQQQEAAFSEPIPSSDADTYAGDRNPTVLGTKDSSYISINDPPNQLYVNLNQLPRELRFFGLAQHSPGFIRAIQGLCKEATQVLGRPVEQQEADAIAFHSAKTVRIASYGPPVGMAIASALAFRSSAKYRFPGWTPGAKFNPDKFLALTGRRANLMWHIFRVQAYWFVGLIAGEIFFGSYGLTVGQTGKAMDPRMKDINEAVRARQRNRGGLPGGREVDQTAGPRDGETQAMARQRQRAQEAQNAWERKRQQSAGRGSSPGQVDDMSPSGGAFGSEYLDLGSANSVDTGMMSDDQARQSTERLESRQRAEYAAENAPRQSSQRQQQHNRASDPSPNSHSEPTPKQTGGSAWDRIRQQAASSGQSQTPPQSRTLTPQQRNTGRIKSPSQDDDGFAFSTSDEERQLARAEAQKEFDQRIERERSGKDFEERSSGGKRW